MKLLFFAVPISKKYSKNKHAIAEGSCQSQLKLLVSCCNNIRNNNITSLQPKYISPPKTKHQIAEGSCQSCNFVRNSNDGHESIYNERFDSEDLTSEEVFLVAVCCSVLQCVTMCRSVLPCVAVCCSVLQCVAVCCSILQCLTRF